MPVFINSAESISPQKTFQSGSFLSDIVTPEGNYFSCITPDYKEYINPRLLRRMSSIVRMGIASSQLSLDHAGIEQPDAIVVGTGLGCVEDTLKFLNQVIENNETLLNPTSFIQSTHNTVSGQIALMLECQKYNMTFSQKAISFESALIDVNMLLKDKDAQHVLVGGIDELVEESFLLLVEAGCAKARWEDEVLKSTTPGAIAGEGAAFFVMSDSKNKNTQARLDAVEIIHGCSTAKEVTLKLQEFLENKGLSMADMDVLISGKNGDTGSNQLYEDIHSLFSKSIVVAYKHLVGEYDTASAFGTYLATKMIHMNAVPESIRQNGQLKEKIRRCLLVNYTRNKELSCILLSDKNLPALPDLNS
jgi:3-oxoacyl-(acyl-carrier-protein) synthase